MDPNVIAAIISVSGSASLAGIGAIATWYNKRKQKQNLKSMILLLKNHPVTTLNTNTSLLVMCHDSVKGDLLNAIQIAVICIPVQDELKTMLRRLELQGNLCDIKNINESVALTREQILRSQHNAAKKFPEATQEVIGKLITFHADSLAIASDLYHCLYAPWQVLELVFNIFYVSTLSVLAQWMQTANQLNGQLNGIWWKEKCIGYIFGGNVTDALRILNPTILSMHEAIGSHDSWVCLIDKHKTILGCCGIEPSLGHSAVSLTGMSLATLQLGVEDIDPNEDLKAYCGTEISSQQGLNLINSRYRVLDKMGVETLTVCFSSSVQLSLPHSQNIKLVLFVKVKCDEINCDESVDRLILDDAHTRLAFIISILTHPVRRIATGCSLDNTCLPLVKATIDGSPDLPHFAVNKLLHAQMGVAQRRIYDACARCDTRLQGDLLRCSSILYSWQGTTINAEFYKIGTTTNSLMSIHRPVLLKTEEQIENVDEGLSHKRKTARMFHTFLKKK